MTQTALPEISHDGGVGAEASVMPAGYLPAFDGSPVIASCENCANCIDQSDGPEYGPAWYSCEKPGREFMSNLRGFPFTTAQKCCELDVAYLVDWDAEARMLGYKT
jgi:hypothetical protein